MQRAKMFFYVCAGLFLLAVSYTTAAPSAQASEPGAIVAAVQVPASAVGAPGSDAIAVFLGNGDYYRIASNGEVAYVGQVPGGAVAFALNVAGNLYLGSAYSSSVAVFEGSGDYYRLDPNGVVTRVGNIAGASITAAQLVPG